MRYPSLLFIAACVAATAAIAAAPTGKAAPDFTAMDALSGKEITLSQFVGKPVVLEWNNFECPFTKKHYSVGNMQALQKKSIADGAVWITINSGGEGKQGYLADDAAAVETVKAHGGNQQYYVRDSDGKIGRAFGASTTPDMFVIDKKGVLAYSGAIDSKPSADPADIASATNYVSAALNALASDKPVSPATTQPYGCGVKYGY
jgi:hypothetical protein